MKTKKSLFAKIAICSLICIGVGGFSGFVTADSVNTWYSTLEKPFFNPPGWVFGPVWTVLYLLMGVSAGIIWENSTNNPAAKKALYIFGIHLTLNATWTLLFFGMQSPIAAFAEILVLLASIIWFTRLFYRENKIAGLIQIPYILWVSFATILNGSIVWLN